MHLMPGTTRRMGDNWNDRQGDVEIVPVGAVLKGDTYPELQAVNPQNSGQIPSVRA